VNSSEKPKIILDCNVWLDWLLFCDPGVRYIQALHAANSIELIASDTMRSELLDVLQRPQIGLKFIARSKFATVEAMMREYDAVVRTIHAEQTDESEIAWPVALPLCKDKDDQMFVELLVAQAAVLITKDKALLALASRLKKRFGLSVGTPNTIKKLLIQPTSL
jgi:putative PIN family toxin of toxin-antitoxin system